jgi:hypothetical protein
MECSPQPARRTAFYGLLFIIAVSVELADVESRGRRQTACTHQTPHARDRRDSNWSTRGRPGWHGRSGAAICVAAPDARAEAVESIVGDRESLLVSFEGCHGHNRPKISSWKIRILLWRLNTVGLTQ